MLVFKAVKNEDIKKITPYLLRQSFRTCDYTSCSIFMWRDYYKCEYTVEDNVLFMKNQLIDGSILFSYPIGFGDIDLAIKKIENYAKMNNLPLIYGFVPKEGLDKLSDIYLKNIKVSTSIDNSDYLYKVTDLINLEGYNYKNQRNRINKFLRTYSNYEYVKIDINSIELIKSFLQKYIDEHVNKGELYIVENEKTFEVLNNFDLFELHGGYIKIDNEIIGFALGEIIKDTMYLHIEKALVKYTGAYQILNNEFFKQTRRSDVIYANLEEDMGDEGLRRAKQSYQPLQLLDKYIVEINI